LEIVNDYLTYFILFYFFGTLGDVRTIAEEIEDLEEARIKEKAFEAKKLIEQCYESLPDFKGNNRVDMQLYSISSSPFSLNAFPSQPHPLIISLSLSLPFI